MNELLNELLNQCRAIRPDVRFVSVENYAGDHHTNTQFWAHATNVAFSGYTITELMDDIRASLADDSESAVATMRMFEACGIPVGAA